MYTLLADLHTVAIFCVRPYLLLLSGVRISFE